MKLSIITVNLNNREGLRSTMNSVLGQTCRDFEYIIIDGGSMDGSLEVIRASEKTVSHWVSERDGGIYQAMNKGIAAAKGDYLLFLNSGDYLINEQIIGKVIPKLGSSDIVYGDLRVVQKGKHKDRTYPETLTFSYFVGKSIAHPSSFISRSLFEKVGPYDESMQICADWAFFIRAIGLFNASYQHLPLITTVFNADGVSSQAGSRSLMIQEQVRLLKNDFSFFETDYESYLDLKDNMEAIRRSKPYKFLKFLGLRKYQS